MSLCIFVEKFVATFPSAHCTCHSQSLDKLWFVCCIEASSVFSYRMQILCDMYKLRSRRGTHSITHTHMPSKWNIFRNIVPAAAIHFPSSPFLSLLWEKNRSHFLHKNFLSLSMEMQWKIFNSRCRLVRDNGLSSRMNGKDRTEET